MVSTQASNSQAFSGPSKFRDRLHHATREGHHALDHHPLLSVLLSSGLTLTQFGNALAALHGFYACSEAAVLVFLQENPGLFDYASLRKSPALEADLASLRRRPVPLHAAFPKLDSVGALFGALYTLEGSMLGGQVIARRLVQHPTLRFPLRFYGLYGDQAQGRWQMFLHSAECLCPPEEIANAELAAVESFETIRIHLCYSRRYLGLQRVPVDTGWISGPNRFGHPVISKHDAIADLHP